MSVNAETIILATELTAAWLQNPNTRVSIEDVPVFLASVHQVLDNLGSGSTDPAAEPPTEVQKPAVSVRKSLANPDRIISMIDGKPYASLKRHLREHGLTPDQYRERYGLKRDYPMVAAAYSEARSTAAKRHGFGRKIDELGNRPAAPSSVSEQEGGTVELVEKAAEPDRKRLGIAGAKAAARQHLGESRPLQASGEDGAQGKKSNVG